MTLDNWASPIDRDRMGGTDILTRIEKLETRLAQTQAKDVVAQTLTEISPDTWATDLSSPYVAGGRLVLDSGNYPLQIVYKPWSNNQVAIYDGSQWPKLPFDTIAIPYKQSQNGTTSNGSAIITGLTDTSQLAVGMRVTGAGIPTTPTATTISTIDSLTQVTLSANATASATVSITFFVGPCRTFDLFIMDSGVGVPALRMVLRVDNATKTITGVTNASPMVVTSAGHGFSPGEAVAIENVAGATGANGFVWRVGTVAANTFQLLNWDGTNSAAGGVYASGGIAYRTRQAHSFGGTFAAQDGISVLAADHGWRWLGSARTTSDPANADVVVSRTQSFLWNAYNQEQWSLERDFTTPTTWTLPVINTWFPINNDISNILEWVDGGGGDANSVDPYISFIDGIQVTNSNGAISIIFDFYTLTNGGWTQMITGQLLSQNASAVRNTLEISTYMKNRAQFTNTGYHFAAGQEIAASTTAVVFLGLITLGGVQSKNMKLEGLIYN